MKYKVLVSIPFIAEVDASSEEDAKKQMEQYLINNGQIKPCEPVSIEVIKEIKDKG